MRFKRGSKVEIFINKDVPSWRCAEIVSGNGRTYSIRYDCPPGSMNEAAVDRVPRKIIRPSPPAFAVKNWAAGEMVEVFNDLSWKIATVISNMGGNYYLVRLVGSLKELQVSKTDIRVRQTWQYDKWSVIGKDREAGFGKSIKKLIPNYDQGWQAVEPGDSYSAVQNNDGCLETNVVSARTLKRVSPFGSSRAEACGNSRKVIVIDRESLSRRVMSGYPSSVLKKVDAVACPRESLGKIYMHASSKKHSNGYCEMERRQSNFVVEYLRAGSSEANDSDSDACSVGSCSVASYNQSMMSSRILAGSSADVDTLSSDADSFYGCGDEEKCTSPLEEDVAARIHRLELHAYRSTLEALFASGPLSWEQEALLTNLRLSLNISNDEHLMEVKNLISVGTSSYISNSR